MRVGLTGATGIVGQFVLADLLKRGCEVRALVRQPMPERHSALVQLSGDIRQMDSLESLLEGCDAAVHCAFSHVPCRYRGGEGDDPIDFWETNLLGTLGFLEAARTQSVRRAVLVSSRAVFTGESRAGRIKDDGHHSPDGHYGIIKSASEQLARLYNRTAGLKVAVIRPTGVYGLIRPLERTKWYRLVKRVMAEEKISEVRASTEIHGRDLAAAIWLLLSSESSLISDSGYNCSDIEIDTRELVAIIAEQTNVKIDLPAVTSGVSCPMDTGNLKALGWQPGGYPLLKETIRQLIEAIRTG